ncbi:LppU/SCO3897 family protein [Nocardia sp. NPDC003482]|uniref:LppU/SCO3897 family protein n=1 Tax=Nocardia sp. NPDC004068 TaxID=3364303 RepID=UPI0036AB8359
MARRRVQAGLKLGGFVLGGALMLAALGAVALSMSGKPAERTANPRAAASFAPVPSATGAAPSPDVTEPAPPAAPLVLNKGAEQGLPGLDVAVGDCVTLGENTVEKTSCAAGSGYRVADRAAGNAQCPADADRTFPRALPGGDHDSLCLDVNWVVGGCMDLTGTPHPVDCAAPGRVRVVGVKQGTADVNTCSASDRGVVYSQRRFVVCVSSR